MTEKDQNKAIQDDSSQYGDAPAQLSKEKKRLLKKIMGKIEAKDTNDTPALEAPYE